MSFLSQHLLNKQAKHSATTLAEVIKRTTDTTLRTCQQLISTQITSGNNFRQPDPLKTLSAIDFISNECCRVIDSSLLLYKNYSATHPTLQQACTDSMDSVNDYFSALNGDRKLFNTLLSIQANHEKVSLMDPEDLFLLNSAIKDLSNAQKSQNFDDLQHRVHVLHRQFMKNLSQEEISIRLSKIELNTIPLGRKNIKKYEGLFTKENEVRVIKFDSRQEFEMAKYSHFPQVREKYFKAISSNGPNTDLVKELISIRQKLAGNQQTYFDKQNSQQSVKITGLDTKLRDILAVIREHSKRDIEIIKQITGEPDIKFHDIAFLKEKLKGILLQRDPKNIQMLTCFTLSNVFKGLLIMTAEMFGQDIGLKTVILNVSKEGQFNIEESHGYQLHANTLKGLSDNQIPLLIVTLKGNKGTIIIDLFQRKHKLHKSQTQTLTEQGASLIQAPVAYIVDSLPVDTQYLSFDQVRNIFHEYGHALNVSLSKTKYQYYSCARGTTDLVEIPSHFSELFLKDYSFVRKFATTFDNPQGQIDDNIKNTIDKHFAKPVQVPIDRIIFDKMHFCDEIFRFLNLEETLYFTRLDFDLNSLQTPVSEEKLLEINKKALSETFTCNQKGVKNDGKPVAPANDEKIRELISQTLSLEREESNEKVYRQISDILFSQGITSENSSDQDQHDAAPEKVKEFEQNYLFNRFHHLFEYDATYYAYLIAKVASQKMYDKGVTKVGGEIRVNKEVMALKYQKLRITFIEKMKFSHINFKLYNEFLDCSKEVRCMM